MLKVKVLILLSTFLLLVSCSTRNAQQLVSIQLTDHNGLSETFNSPERLKLYEKTDFSSPQPFAQVVRVYKDKGSPGTCSKISSYYSNGQVEKQLDAVGTQALGSYKEWHYNGTLRLHANVVGGRPELTPAAEKTWLFHGIAEVWDERGNLRSSYKYDNGVLVGSSEMYHSNGKLWKKFSYKGGRLHGTLKTLFPDGRLLSSKSFSHGVPSGRAVRYWPNGKIASEENYNEGELIEGKYFSPREKQIFSVHNGRGHQALFRKNSLYMVREIQNGYPDGKVVIYTTENKPKQEYHIKNGVKHGTETIYYPDRASPRQRFQWSNGKLSGITKTWYPNGNQEMVKEITSDYGPKLITAWFEDGSLMLSEAYKHGMLEKGDYYPKGSQTPISSVTQGCGIATIFDQDGTFLFEVVYQDGEPIVE